MIFNVIILSSISKISLHSILQNNVLNLNTLHHTRLVSRKSQSGVKWAPQKCSFLRCKGILSHSPCQQGCTLGSGQEQLPALEQRLPQRPLYPTLTFSALPVLLSHRTGRAEHQVIETPSSNYSLHSSKFVCKAEKEQILQSRSQNCRANKCKCALSAGTSALEH